MRAPPATVCSCPRCSPGSAWRLRPRTDAEQDLGLMEPAAALQHRSKSADGASACELSARPRPSRGRPVKTDRPALAREPPRGPAAGVRCAATLDSRVEDGL